QRRKAEGGGRNCYIPPPAFRLVGPGSADEGAAEEQRVEGGEEEGQPGGAGVVDGDDRLVGGPGGDDDARPRGGAEGRCGDADAGGVGVVLGHLAAAGDAVEGHEAAQQRVVQLAAEDLDVRPAADGGGGDDVGGAVLVDVGGGDVDAALERRVVGE